jgi:hypothetical protein
VAGGWWLVADGWWLVAGGWWLVAGGRWLGGGCGEAEGAFLLSRAWAWMCGFKDKLYFNFLKS